MSYCRLDLQQEKTRAVIMSSGKVTVVYPVAYDTSASVASNATVTARFKSVIGRAVLFSAASATIMFICLSHL